MALLLLALSVLLAAIGCRSGGGEPAGDTRGIIVVNAPAAGEVRRILVHEGASVGDGEPIIELAVRSEIPLVTPSPGESAESRAVRGFKAADAEIEAARAEVVRHEAEVQRLTPLVATGEAPAGQLDGERALYERAQRRLQQAQDAKRNAESGLLAARQPAQQQQQGSARPAAPLEQTVAARASSSGTVSVISVRVGERVTAGQPLATLRADHP